MIKYMFLLVAFVFTSELAYSQVVPAFLDGKPVPKVARQKAPGEAWPVWIAYDGFEPFSKPSSSSARVGGVRLKFMQKCYFVEKSQTVNDVDFYCLGSEDGILVNGEFQVNRILGWVPVDYVITAKEAKQLDREGGKVRGMHRKAIIVNTEDQLFRDRSYSSTVSLRTGPSLSSPKISELRLFSFFFIYGEVGKGTEVTADDFTLLGAAQEFEDLPPGTSNANSYTPEKVLLGWVPSERLVEWNSREAVYWDFEATKPEFSPRRQVAGKLWKTPADAYSGQPEVWVDAFTESKLSPPPLKKVPEQLPPEEGIDSQTGESSKPEYNDMLFPILEYDRTMSRDKTYLRKTPRGWQLERVGILADFVAGNVRVSRQKVAEFQEKLDRMKEQSRITEVLFVVDDTSSMRDWYDKYTAEAIKKIVESAKKGDREVRIAISYYNDKDVPQNARPDGYVERGVEVGPLVSSRDNNGKAVDGLLENARKHAHRGGGGGPLEMLHQGLYTAVTKTDFEANSQKLIVILGDYGDRGEGPTVDEIADEIRRLGENTLILGVHVAESVVKIRQDPDLQAFANSVKDLISRVEEGRDNKLSLYETASNLEIFLDKIDECYQKLEGNLEKYQVDLQRAKQGSVAKSIIRQLQRDISNDKEMQDLIAALSEGKGAQFFYEGYAWLYDGDKPEERAKGYMYPYILATTGEITKVTKLIEGVAINSSGNLTELKSAATSVTAAQVPVTVNPTARDYAQDIDDSALAQTLTIMKWVNANKQNNKLTLSSSQFAILKHKHNLLIDALKEDAFDYRESTTLFNGQAIPQWNRFENSKKHEPRLWVVPGLSEESTFKWIWIDRRKEWP
jgi:hypothetical protein